MIGRDIADDEASKTLVGNEDVRTKPEDEKRDGGLTRKATLQILSPIA